MRMVLVMAMVAITLPVNAEPSPQRKNQLDREYEEAVYACQLLHGEPGSKKRWQAVLTET